MILLFATFLTALGTTNAVVPASASTNIAGSPPAVGAPVVAGERAADGSGGVGATSVVGRAVDFALPAATGPAAESPADLAYRRLLETDDKAHEEMDRWIREADERGPAADQEVLKKRVQESIASLDAAYGEFLGRYPEHVAARVAFGSFLNNTGREAEARVEWERALKLDPKDPAIYNNLAGTYGHTGPVTNAFVYYEKAIELDPKEPVYHQNFATTLCLFRRDVMEHYGFKDEQAVFDKSLFHYRRALELDPRSFLIATDLAQTYYLIKPPRHDDALAAWRRAYELASDDLEREGIRVHLARVQVQAGRFAEARTNLVLITNANYSVVKDRITKTLESREKESGRKDDARTVPTPPADDAK